MADNQSTINEGLISAGLNTSNPAGTYVDFAEQIAKNQQEQAAQEQALALAKQHVAQAQLQTRQQTEADQAGVNPELKGYITRANAISQARLILEQKGAEINDDILNQWATNLPEMVPMEEVNTFANRFMSERSHLGQPFQATKADAESNKTDENGDPLVPGEMYSTIYDNSMKKMGYIRAGKEPTDLGAKAGQHTADQNRKDWKDLTKLIDTAFKTRSGGLGSLVTSVYRANRAINTLNSHTTLTAQDLANVAQDIGGIYQGGAPTVVSAEDNDYSTIFTKLSNFLRHYTGIILDPGAPVEQTREKLLQVVTSLRDSATESFRAWMSAQAQGYAEAIASDQTRWEKLQADMMKAIESGLQLTPQEKALVNLTGAEFSTPAKNPLRRASDAVKAAIGGDQAPQSGGLKMPSLDEIKAERERRKQEKK